VVVMVLDVALVLDVGPQVEVVVDASEPRYTLLSAGCAAVGLQGRLATFCNTMLASEKRV